MKLIFLGTRGYIDARTRLHRMHSSMKVVYRGKNIVIDCGEDWLGKVDKMDAGAYFITHGHPDHCWGLKDGAPCGVYATEESWSAMKNFDIKDRHTLNPREPVTVNGITVESFPVIHSIIAPATGYRVAAGQVAIFYAPDVVYIPDREEALGGAKAYIGDGATIERSMVRRKGDQLFGHTPIRTQLTWCEKEGVPLMIVTHCGSQIVAKDERKIAPRIKDLADERGVDAVIAHDGMELVLR
jgi:phosphoribosyl 1,2-cyclic phosphodiesterase